MRILGSYLVLRECGGEGEEELRWEPERRGAHTHRAGVRSMLRVRRG